MINPIREASHLEIHNESGNTSASSPCISVSWGDTERTCSGSSGSLLVLFSPHFPSLSLPALSPFPASSVTLFLNPSNVYRLPTTPLFVLCVVASPGVWTVHSLHYTWGSQERAHRFPLGVGMLDSGHHVGENAQLSLCFNRCCVYKVLGFPTQDRRDASESKKTHN